MSLIQLDKCDILDQFDDGNWVLLNACDKSNMINPGDHVYIRDRKALVEKIIFGKSRLALEVIYEKNKDDDVVELPLLEN